MKRRSTEEEKRLGKLLRELGVARVMEMRGGKSTKNAVLISNTLHANFKKEKDHLNISQSERTSKFCS